MNKQQLLTVILAVAILSIIGIFSFSKKHKKSEEPIKPFEVKEAQQAFEEGRLTDARKIYNDSLAGLENNPQAFNDVQHKVEDLNMKILLSPAIDENSEEYEVKPGDSLTRIAKKYNTTIELIKQVNNLPSDNLRVGQKLKVITAKFSVFVDKSQNILQLKANDRILKTYVVSTGANNSTPVGTFKVVNKLPEPTWFRAGAVIPPGSTENALGARWLGLDVKGYGIHGTIEPDKMGQQVTLGCVRMLNEEVIELYSLVPTGTEVTIVD